MTFDYKRLYEDLGLVVEAQGKSWREVSAEIGVPRATLARLGEGKGIGAGHLAAVLGYVGGKFEGYVEGTKKRRKG